MHHVKELIVSYRKMFELLELDLPNRSYDYYSLVLTLGITVCVITTVTFPELSFRVTATGLYVQCIAIMVSYLS